MKRKEGKCLISSFSNLRCSLGRLKAHSQSCWHDTLPQHCDPCLNFLRGTMVSLSSSSSSSWIHHITLFFSSDSAHSLRQSKGNIYTSSWLKENHFPPSLQGESACRSKINESFGKAKEICMSRYMLLSAFKINKVLFQHDGLMFWVP